MAGFFQGAMSGATSGSAGSVGSGLGSMIGQKMGEKLQDKALNPSPQSLDQRFGTLPQIPQPTPVQAFAPEEEQQNNGLDFLNFLGR